MSSSPHRKPRRTQRLMHAVHLIIRTTVRATQTSHHPNSTKRSKPNTQKINEKMTTASNRWVAAVIPFLTNTKRTISWRRVFVVAQQPNVIALAKKPEPAWCVRLRQRYETMARFIIGVGEKEVGWVEWRSPCRPTIFFVDPGRIRVVGRRRLGSLTHPTRSTQSNPNNEAGHCYQGSGLV